MTVIACPWCDEDAELSLTTLAAEESLVVCASCGTAVEVTEEPASRLDLAA
jgi:transcription elongation factor Elf1